LYEYDPEVDEYIYLTDIGKTYYILFLESSYYSEIYKELYLLYYVMTSPDSNGEFKLSVFKVA
jgi:hypothetical protein